MNNNCIHAASVPFTPLEFNAVLAIISRSVALYVRIVGIHPIYFYALHPITGPNSPVNLKLSIGRKKKLPRKIQLINAVRLTTITTRRTTCIEDGVCNPFIPGKNRLIG